MPTDATDPSGEIIFSHCSLKTYIDSWVNPASYHETDWADLAQAEKLYGPKGYSYTSKLNGNSGGLQSQILIRMMKSPFVYRVAGTAEADCLKNIELQVDTRMRITLLATGAKFVIVQYNEQGESNANLQRAAGGLTWSDNPIAFYNHVNYASTNLGCSYATELVFYTGIFGANKGVWETGDATRTVSGDDFVPGDRGIFNNAGGGWDKLHEAENVIRVGDDKFWGLGGGSHTMADWSAIFNTWTNSTGAHGKLEVYPTVWFPAAGLENKRMTP
jgi:hypothetical protein